MGLLTERELTDLRGETEAEMTRTCSIWRRPDNAGGYQQPAHELLVSGVPYYRTATGSNPLLRNPYTATYAQTGEAGTMQPYTLTFPLGLATPPVQADVVVDDGDGLQLTVINQSGEAQETEPLALVVQAEKLEMTLTLTP